MSSPTATVEADLDDSGAFATDISAYVKALNIAFGRSSILEKPGPRTCELVLDNQDSRFSPDNSGGAYSPNWVQDKRIRVKLAVETAALTNLVENPSAENDVTGFVGVNCTPAQSTAKARYGKASCKIECASATVQIVQITKRSSSRIDVSASTDYVFRVRLFAENGASSWRLLIGWYNGSPISTSTGDYTEISQDGPWTILMLKATSPVGAVTALPYIQEESGTANDGENLYIDGVEFYEGTDDEIPYCDGDVPGSTWSGTAHESTSSRTANPEFTKFYGRITEIECRRDMGHEPPYYCVVRAVSEMDRLLDKQVRLGNMVQHTGDNVLQVILDRLEEGEIMDNLGLQYSGASDLARYPLTSDWTGIGAQTATQSFLSTVLFAYEGDYLQGYGNTAATAAGDGFELDVGAEGCGANEHWRYAIVIRRHEDGGHDGKEVKLAMVDSGGTIDSATGTIPSSDDRGVYLEVHGTWTNGGSNRKLQITCNEAFAASPTYKFCIDCYHGAPYENRIDREMVYGTGKTAFAELEHVASFFRDARPLLNDVVDSIGGIMWEAGDGTFKFEDYYSRIDSPIPVLRFTDSASEQDGEGIPPATYGRTQDRLYDEVVVRSNGELLAGEVAADPIWSMETALTLAADTARWIYATYYSDDEGPVVGERPNLRTNVSAGSLLATSFPINWGFGAEVYLIAGGSGVTVDGAFVTCDGTDSLRRQFQPHRSRVTSGTANKRSLEIDMPYQGDETTPMSDVAARMVTLLSSGRQAISVPYRVGDDALSQLYACGLDVSDPIWVRHNSGFGHFGLDEAFYLEGGTLSFDAGSHRTGFNLTLTMYLDPAA